MDSYSRLATLSLGGIVEGPVEHENEPPERRAWSLECMPTRSYLLRDLATGMTQSEAGRKYGVSQVAVHKFARRHADEIRAIAGDLDNEYAGLWVAERVKRIEAYQTDAELLDRYIQALADEGMELDAKLLRTKHQAIRAVAEELGQLKTVIDHTATVRHELVGVDTEDLK